MSEGKEKNVGGIEKAIPEEFAEDKEVEIKVGLDPVEKSIERHKKKVEKNK
jgi:hypothetical protein